MTSGTSQLSQSTAVPSPALTGGCRSYRAAEAPGQRAVGRGGVGPLGGRRRAAAAVAKSMLGVTIPIISSRSWYLGPLAHCLWWAAGGGNGSKMLGTLPWFTRELGARLRGEDAYATLARAAVHARPVEE